MTKTEAPSNANIVDYLFEACLRPEHADRTAFIVGDKHYSFADIHRRVCQVANLLRSCGIQPGERVMISVMDGRDFPALFLGALKMGAVAVAINTFLKPADYRYYINDSGAKALFIDTSLVPAIEEIKAELAEVAHIIVAGSQATGYPFLDEALAAQPMQAPTLPRTGDDMAFFLYSSGTTGAPKGVVHRHADIYHATELFGLGVQGISRDDVVQCAPKMFFAFGLGNQVYFPLRAAATVVVNPEPATPARLWDLWLKHEPTIAMSVPTLYAGMLRLAETEIDRERVRHALRRMRFAVSGGEALPPSLAKKWLEFTGVEILDGVGTTEMTHMFLLNRPGHSVPGSCGRIVEGYRALIVDDEGRQLPTGEVGNLLVCGDSAMRQYWNKPDRTAAAIRDGGVLTGDKVRVDQQGNYYFVGRSDDMLRVGGVWVSPIEVETVLSKHPSVLECAVVGVPDDNEMIKPKGFVVPRDANVGDKAALERELKEFCRSHLAHIKCPRWIEIVDELPKTTTGKIQRFRLRGTGASPVKT